MIVVEGEIKDRELIEEIWGPGFGPVEDDDREGETKVNPLLRKRRVHFTADYIGVELRKPVTLLDGETTSLLKLTEPYTGDLVAMDAAKQGMAKLVILLTAVAGISAGEARKKIKAGDFILLSEVLNGFLSDGLLITLT